MVDDAGNDKGSPIAIKLGSLENGSNGLVVRQNTDRTVVCLVSRGETSPGSGRVCDKIVVRVGARVADRLSLYQIVNFANGNEVTHRDTTGSSSIIPGAPGRELPSIMASYVRAIVCEAGAMPSGTMKMKFLGSMVPRAA